LPSLAYTIVPATVETGSGTSYVSRFEFTGTEANRSVRDLLTASSSMDAEQRLDRDEAADWLTSYLTDCGGEAARQDVLKAARAARFSEATLKRARSKAGVTADRQGFGGGSVWKLQTRSAHHSDHSAQVSEGEPDEPNDEPNGETSTACAACGSPLDATLAQAGETAHPGCARRVPTPLEVAAIRRQPVGQFGGRP
jgi:hypothetical protein